MDNQTKIIIGLFALILILAIIFGLKITGIIKPTEKNEVIEEQSINKLENVVTEQETNLNKDEIIIIDYGENNTNNKTSKNFIYETLSWYSSFASKYGIVIFVITIILNIGIARLYTKISMPGWIVLYQYLYVFIELFAGMLPNIIDKIISLITGIISIIIMAYYFSAAGMSKIWSICPVMIPILSGMGISAALNSALMFGPSSAGLFSILLLIGTFAAMVAYIVAYIISNIRIAGKFEKGVGFKIGIAILPTVFQAILGYQKN